MLLKGIFLTGSYSNQIFPDPLSKEEEDYCIKQMMLGDTNSRNKLIEHNLRLVAHIVKKFEHDANIQDDLISIGTIGLIKGIDTYSNNKNVKLTLIPFSSASLYFDVSKLYIPGLLIISGFKIYKLLTF